MEALVDCCAPADPRSARGSYSTDRPLVSRRQLLRGMVITAGAVGLAACGVRPGEDEPAAELEEITLAFCGQLLCVVPYEVTRDAGYFADEGLDVELIYSRGGGDAVQALNGGAVDYAASSFDAMVGAVASGANVKRFMTTGRLPLFALATAIDTADEIQSVEDLAGRQVGISALGNADHTIVLYVLDRAGVDPDSVRFAALGTNLYDALRLGQVDAGMVQEPALSLLLEDGAGELINFMEIDEANEVFGGAYEFMGVAIRDGEQEQRAEQLQGMARAMTRGLERVQTADVQELLAALPSELTAGEDLDQLGDIVERYRESLWPTEVDLDTDAAQRVVTSLQQAGVLDDDLSLDEALDMEVLA
jgi:NitT/TauT family transport system substrate-binding protein